MKQESNLTAFARVAREVMNKGKTEKMLKRITKKKANQVPVFVITNEDDTVDEIPLAID